MHKQLVRVGLTMGDPAGVGPELCVRALQSPELQEICSIAIFGNPKILQAVATKLHLPLSANILILDEWRDLPEANLQSIVAIEDESGDTLVPGSISALTGRSSFRFVDCAINAALAGKIDAITTGPINKEALHMAGYKFPGHTEIFGSRMEAKRFCMLQYSEEITCSFVTTHVGYADVPDLLTEARILEVIELTQDALMHILGRSPKMLVCGLNPHAGEHGLFGSREEERIIVPAVRAARERGYLIEGPVPADTAFIPARRREIDAFICMYHDQGHIPLKALAFDCAVNTTLGLPIVRTSVDHGTALDIAWRGIADPGSLFAAVKLAAKLAVRNETSS